MNNLQEKDGMSQDGSSDTEYSRSSDFNAAGQTGPAPEDDGGGTDDSGSSDSSADEQDQDQGGYRPPRRVTFLWVFGGIYLIYTGVTLAKGFINGDPQSSVAFLLSGIAFIAIGAFLAIKGGINMSRDAKESQQERQQQAAAEKQPAESRKMSISERARLASADQDESDTESADTESPTADHTDTASAVPESSGADSADTVTAVPENAKDKEE